jgi:hypothetical protein
MKTLSLVTLVLVVMFVSCADSALVEHWSFDDAVGSAVAAGVNGFDGAVTGGTFTGPGGGVVGGALHLGGAAQDKVDPPVNTIAGINGAVTVAYWMKGDDDMPMRNYMVAAFGPGWNLIAQNPDNLYGLQHVWQAGGNLVSGPATSSAAGDGQLTEYKNQWNHWAMTFDISTGELNMYLNGNYWLGTTGNTLAVNGSGNFLFSIGNHPYGGAPYKGLIDELYIYDTALSPAEIERLANPDTLCQAWNPSPADNAGIQTLTQILGWDSGDGAVSHHVYFATDFDEIDSAVYISGDLNCNGMVGFSDLIIFCGQWLQSSETFECSSGLIWDDIVNFVDFSVLARNWGLSVEAFKGNFTSLSYDPGQLESGKTYYWRVDEVKDDDICRGKVWSFTTGLYVERIELAGSELIGGDAGNSWGCHHTRVVRTPESIFTAYTVEGTGKYSHTSAFDKEWRLSKRTGQNNWFDIAEGPSGREPVNLLYSSSGYISLIAWPDKIPHMWVFDSAGSYVTDYDIPGSWFQNDWPYHSAGIDNNGNIAVLQSTDVDIRWAYFNAAADAWTYHDYDFTPRHCYTYMFPKHDGSTSWINTVDVLWYVLGLCKPSPSMSGDYAFNSFGYWYTPDHISTPISFTKIKEAVQDDCEMVYGFAFDSYEDTSGRTHVLYRFIDDGQDNMRHAVIQNGTLVNDVNLPVEVPDVIGQVRIFQDTLGKFYILCPDRIYPALSEDGTVLNEPIMLDFAGSNVGAIFVAVPRTGTPISDFIDGVFTSTTGSGDLRYFRINLR